MKTVEIFWHIETAFSHNKSYCRSFSVVILPTCLFRQKANFVYCCTWFENLPFKKSQICIVCTWRWTQKFAPSGNAYPQFAHNIFNSTIETPPCCSQSTLRANTTSFESRDKKDYRFCRDRYWFCRDQTDSAVGKLILPWRKWLYRDSCGLP